MGEFSEPLLASNVHFTQAMTELTRQTLRRTMLVVIGVCLLWYIVVTATWPEAYGWSPVLLLALLASAGGLSLVILQRNLLAGQIAWQLTLLATITVAMWQFDRSEIAVAYVFLPFFAALTIHWAAGLAAVGGIAFLLAVLPAFGFPELSGPALAGVLIGAAAMGLLGYVASHSLLTTMEWYAHSYVQAEENLLAVRRHRAQLMRVQKSLDEAYYRLKRANAALVAAWKAADEAERFKAEFVANVSHELRTPLNLIVGFSEVMMTSPESYGGARLPGAYRTDLNAIYHSAQHLLALVDDVLDLARMDVGKIAMARDEVEAATLVAEALEIVRDYIASKGLELQVKIAPDVPRLWIDRLRIRQVLLNLLVNAARFTERGFIRVEADAQGDGVQVRVVDSGRGIPAVDLPKIFDEFRSTEQPFSAWHSGTGLGLPISKKFVELNGGTMGVRSVFGQGTEFWFDVPCVGGVALNGVEGGIAEGRAQGSPRGSQGGRRHPGATDGLRAEDRVVVVVHEDARVAGLLERHLDGYRVVHAGRLGEGVAVSERAKALAMITDRLTPDGFVPPPGVLHVRCALPSGQAAAMTLGANNMLVKPVTRQDLERAIEELGRPVRRILITDDDPELVRLFRRMLEGGDGEREFFEAYTGREALEMMRRVEPDLVLLDLVMPGPEGSPEDSPDGRTVLAQMAGDPKLASIATIVVSAKGMDYLAAPLLESVTVSRADGFQLGEVVRTLDAVFRALAPGWHPALPGAPVSVATGPG